jgi:hypothetical protein
MDAAGIDEPTEITPFDRDRLLNRSAPAGSAVSGSSPNGSSPSGSGPKGPDQNGSAVNGSAASGPVRNGSAMSGSPVSGPAVNGAASSRPAVDAAGIDEPTEIVPFSRDRLRTGSAANGTAGSEPAPDGDPAPDRWRAPLAPPAIDQDTVDFSRLAAELRAARSDGRFTEPE